MPDSDPVAERIVLEFLRRYAEDARRGLELDLAHYQALYPEHAARIALEWQALQQAEPRGADAPTGAPHAAAGDPDAPARRLGPYRLLEVLGRGGQGVVHRAVDERIGRTVALKLLPGLAPEDGLPARVQREVEAIARLDHPGLGVVYEAGVLEGQVYLAMRHVPGRSLAELLTERSAAGARSDSRGRRERLRDDVGLVEKLARALHAAHEAGVVHRDVKPANVMVHESGEPVLLDFGLARADHSALATLTASGELLGTTAYMAPERLRGEGGADRRVDVWALGVLLYELLTGRRPFEGPGVDEISRRIRVEEPTDPRRLERGIPRDLAVVLGTALEKDPGKRYPTALAFAEELARVRAGRPVLAKPPNPVGRLRRWAWRHPALASLALLLAAGVVASVWAAVAFADLADAERAARRQGDALNAQLAARSAELADTAARERDARRAAEALLVQRGAEQAELLRLSRSLGRRWEMLAVLEAAARTRAGLEPPLPDDLPSTAALRSLAVEALLTPDARRARVLQRSSLGAGRFSRDGERLALTWVAPDFSTAGLRVLDTADGTERARMEGMFLMSDSFSVALSADAEHLVVPRSDAVSLWRARDVAHVQQFAIPPELGLHAADAAPGSLSSHWEVTFLPGDVYVLGVGAPRRNPDLPHGWALWDARDARLVQTHVTPPDLHAWFALAPDDRHLLLPGGARELLLFGLPADPDGLPPVARLEAPAPVLAAALGPGEPPEIHVLLRPEGASVDELARLAPDGAPLARGALSGRVAPSRPVLVRSPDGRFLAVAGEGGEAWLLRAHDLAPLLAIPAVTRGRLEDLAFRAGGAELLTHAGNEGSDAWELLLDPGFERTLPLRPQAESALAVSADGGLAALLVEGAAAPRLLPLAAQLPPPAGAPPSGQADASGAAPARTPELPTPELTLPSGAAPLRALAVDAAGARVLALSDDAAWLWTLPEPIPAPLPCPPGDAPLAAGFGADGTPRALLVGPDGGARLVDLASGAQHALADLAPDHWITPDAALARALLVSREGARGGMRLATGAPAWAPLPDGPRVVLPGVEPSAFKQVFGARFSRDGARLAAVVYVPRDAAAAAGGVDDCRLLLWDLPRTALLWSRAVDPQVGGVDPAIDPSGAFVCVAETEGRVALLDGATGTLLFRWRAHPDASLAALHLLGDGERLLTRARDGTLKLWELGALRTRLAAMGLGG